jgi:zinc transport system permease protein
MLAMFSYPGTLPVLLALSLLGTVISFIGFPLVVTHRSFTAVTLSQVAAFGSVLGMFAGIHPLFIGVPLITCSLVVLVFVKPGRSGYDSVSAVIFLAAASSSTLIVSAAPSGDITVLSLFFGNILAVLAREAYVGSAIAVLGGVLLLFFYNSICATFNNRLSARVYKKNPLISMAVYIVVSSVVITYSFMLFGVVPVFAFSLVPSLLAVRITNRLRSILAAMAGFSVFASFSGLLIAFLVDLPPGIVISGVCALCAVALLPGQK